MRNTHILISVNERNISTSLHTSYLSAYEQMERELDETMDGNRDGYTNGDDYEFGVDDCSAWSNAQGNHDWLIEELD